MQQLDMMRFGMAMSLEFQIIAFSKFLGERL